MGLSDYDPLCNYLLAKKAATKEIPFGPDALVFKVMGKMFALLAWQDDPLHLSLKCAPQEALLLRAQYPAIKPGYHMNKDHWNTLTLDGSIPDEELQHMIDNSYNLVVKGLPRTSRDRLEKK